MKFNLNKSIQVLNNTPDVLLALLHDLDEEWTNKNEGENTWTAKEVLAHLIVLEETGWLPRVKVILNSGAGEKLAPINMESHFDLAKNTTLEELLSKFRAIRQHQLKELSGLHLSESDFQKTAEHPVLGTITVQQIIATWVTHDLTHTAQISRVMAKQYINAIGPFVKFLNRLN